ncbi:SDR family NAD(P)-dependent oxidoreductase [Streptomyces mirabilis]|uniref:SDR family NAD(P)-dependent oxidoreductase n=1 Tax=Streptomyces mirabilis TaxID=68239 RepID=UPI003680C2AA
MPALDHKTVLVTGAAGGIGSAIARRCAEAGAAVVLTDLDTERLTALAKDLGQAGHRVLSHTVDATDDTAMREVSQQAAAEFGSLDVVFANAGIAAMASLEEITRDLFQRAFLVNTYSVLAAAKAAAEVMSGQENGGKIINTCSIAGKTAYPGHTLYSATKFAVRSFTQGLAKELAGRRITVNSICPGMIDTTLWNPIAERMAKEGTVSSADQALEAFSTDVLVGRPGTPDDLTGLALFLASADSAYLNGQCINVDGGLIFD